MFSLAYFFNMLFWNMHLGFFPNRILLHQVSGMEKKKQPSVIQEN